MASDPALRIAFAGASGTGKSTLMQAVLEEWPLEVNPNGSRSLALEMGFEENGEGRPYWVDEASGWAYEGSIMNGETPRDAADRARFEFRNPTMGMERHQGTVRPMFQRELQKRKIAWEKGRSHFVTDRTTLDDLTYAFFHCRDIVDQEFYSRALNHTIAGYDLVVFCGTNWWLRVDGDPARVADPTYHHMFDATIRGLLRQVEASGVIMIDAGPLIHRPHGVIGHIRDWYRHQ